MYVVLLVYEAVANDILTVVRNFHTQAVLSHVGPMGEMDSVAQNMEPWQGDRKKHPQFSQTRP